MKVFKKFLLAAFSLLISCTLALSCVSASSSFTPKQIVYNKKGWIVYLHTPNSGKGYHHLHFFKRKVHVYCLNLKTMKPCDSTRKNKNKVPKSVKEGVMKNKRVQRAVATYNPIIKTKKFKYLIKPLLIAGASIAVVVATANIFTGPIDDVAAWAALSAALAY